MIRLKFEFERKNFLLSKKNFTIWYEWNNKKEFLNALLRIENFLDNKKINIKKFILNIWNIKILHNKKKEISKIISLLKNKII